MKKLIFLHWLITTSSISFAQFISFEYTQILVYSVEINYSSSTGTYQPWTPDLNFYGNAMAQMQARYDRNHSSLSKEYFKLKDLKLINTTNQSILNNYRSTRLKNCATSDIEKLSWERTELENQNNNSTTNNNYSSNSYQTNYRVPNSSFVYQKNHESIQIDKIWKSEEYTVINLTTFPSKQYSSGWWVSYSPNAYILQNGKKYYLKKAVGIPLLPNKHYFNNINESLSFKLYFDKNLNLEIKFDLIEGVENGFDFYNIRK